MESNTAYDIRRVLASNLKTFAEACSSHRRDPIRFDVESLRRVCERWKGQANFCFQIGAIDASTYNALASIITELTESIIAIRAAVKQTSDYRKAADAATKTIDLLWRAIDLLKDEEQPSIVTLTD